ncbi:MAG: hypothetical protein LBM77_11695 [Spirochaetaceae bacterium]|jgi:hypothetical protein|nr:hypothetical protein [Spirochaetaceae bacterium]
MKSIHFLFIAFFIITNLGAVALYNSAVTKYVSKAEDEGKRKEILVRMTEEVIKRLSAEDFATPYQEWESEHISISPLSDRLNINYVGRNIFRKTRLGETLKANTSIEQLQDYRDKNGLSLNISFYDDFIDFEEYPDIFGVYGWANKKQLDVFAGERLKQYINEDDYFPYINTESMLNCNYIDAFLLECILSYPDYKITGFRAKAKTIIERREQHYIQEDELRRILKVANTNPVYDYLGTITWFWEINAADSKGGCRTIIARLPAKDNEEKEYRVYEQRFY